MITTDEIRAAFDYSPETGEFRWRKDCKWKRYKAGDIAGSNDGRAWRINYGRGYLAHRAAWFYVHGVWPSQYIDHINGNAFDNRLSNLREATPRQNQANKRLSKIPKSGFIGVYKDACDRTWKARIRIDGKNTYLGSFETAELASEAYLAAHKRFHKDFSGIEFREHLGSDRGNGLPSI